MNRRDFLSASLAAGAGALHASPAMANEQSTAGAAAPAREYYELRRYWLRGGPMVGEMHGYLEKASIPALNRAGVEPVGAFTVQFGPETPSIFLLLRHRSIQDFAALESRLAADQEFQQAGASHRDLPATNPAYVRAPHHPSPISAW